VISIQTPNDVKAFFNFDIVYSVAISFSGQTLLSGSCSLMNTSSENQNRSSGRVFATTSWSMVVQAATPESPESSFALADLCDAYWYPLYSFVRRKGYNREEAEDLTQSFFSELLEKKQLSVADQQRGRFRTFLLAALDHFVSKQWRAKNALKRGGGSSIISFDFQTADEQYANEPFHEWTPQKIFERNWALAILSKTLAGVRKQYVESDKTELFEELKVYLGDSSNVTYKSIAEKLDTTEGAIKVAVHRLREWYGEQLRIQIARTVEFTSDVNQELQSLMQALRSSNE
jgi:RNA polymerase sigma factor (sigma-70 family)